MPDTESAPSAPLVSPAPGGLEFVRAFVNTRDIDAGTDRFAEPASWADWAGGHGIQGTTDTEGLAWAIALRESLRQALLANHDRLPLPASTASTLTDASRRSGAGIAFTPDGVVLVDHGDGMDAVVSRVVGATAAALADGTWPRLKACANDGCQWAFYDHSRSRTGRWCSMQLCGNRVKQARWRTGQAT
ncbi:CGNR zinc finger domain-containing protein [Streptosporangium sp. NBC_01639]|uniref:CGNR zinc finger domain-containing protein n=1 Tax=Streptosporangium sp. NBC_01639 TaxID=2975948 RepID=UPI003867D80E|nr:CGNR zinc finger domain-containing protein [Streptosporangium sp. NBC_01639]